MELSRIVRRRDVGVDAAPGAAVALVISMAITADVGGGYRNPDLVAYLFAVGLGTLMLVRRQFPVLALIATSVGLLTYYAFGYPAIGLAIPVAAALYSAAEASRLRWAIGAGVGLLVVSTGYRLAEGQHPAYLLGYELAATVGLMGAVIAIGEASAPGGCGGPASGSGCVRLSRPGSGRPRSGWRRNGCASRARCTTCWRTASRW